jgi:hypothetical protein
MPRFRLDRLSGDYSQTHSKEGCDPRENRDASIPVVAPDRNIQMMARVPTEFQPPPTRTEMKSLFLVWVARNLATALVRSDDSAGLVGSARDQLSGLSDPLGLLNALNRIKQNGSCQFVFSASRI